MMEWGESEKDPRRRGYLCMKRAGGTDRLLMEGIKIDVSKILYVVIMIVVFTLAVV